MSNTHFEKMFKNAVDSLIERGETTKSITKDKVLDYLFALGRSDSEVIALELEFSKWIDSQSL